MNGKTGKNRKFLLVEVLEYVRIRTPFPVICRAILGKGGQERADPAAQARTWPVLGLEAV